MADLLTDSLKVIASSALLTAALMAVVSRGVLMVVIASTRAKDRVCEMLR